VTYRRDVFASYPANAIVVHLTAGKPTTFVASLKCAHAECSVRDGMSGKVADSAIRFDARVEALGGVMSGTSATFILVGATNFKNYRDVSADPAARNKATLAALRAKSYDVLRAEHIRESSGAVPPRDDRPGHVARRQASHRRAHRSIRQRQRSGAGRAAVFSMGGIC